jgi:crotonobetainyl-CoA:carnitine CoA-transferase CaiB-like acyl-CoA transferase
VAQEPRFWDALCAIAGLGEHHDRRTGPTAQDAIRARLTAFFAPLTRAEVEKLFDDHDGCVSPVLSYEEMLETPRRPLGARRRRGAPDPGAHLPCGGGRAATSRARSGVTPG